MTASPHHTHNQQVKEKTMAMIWMDGVGTLIITTTTIIIIIIIIIIVIIIIIDANCLYHIGGNVGIGGAGHEIVYHLEKREG